MRFLTQSLIPAFVFLSSHYLPKAGIKLLLIIYLLSTRVKNLIPCFLAFWSISGYYLPFKFLIFYYSCKSINVFYVIVHFRKLLFMMLMLAITLYSGEM